MKKILLLLLTLISSTLLAQVKPDTAKTKKDSVEIKPFIIRDEEEVSPKKKKKVVEKDTTTSYADEYRRDVVKFQWGVRGSVNFGSFNVKDINAVRVTSSGTPLLENNRIIRDQFLRNKEKVVGYLGGIFVRMTRGSFYFQPEVVYAVNGGKFDILQSDGTLYRRVNANYSAIDVPVLFGIRFRKGRVFAGPTIDFPLNFNKELEDALKIYTIADFKKYLFSRPSFGINAGIGFEFEHFFIEGRFVTALSNAINYEIGPTSNPSQFQVLPSSFQISIGLVN